MSEEQRTLTKLFVPMNRAECIRILRLRLGYTQDQVAADLGIARERISKMETQFMNVSDAVWDYMLQRAYRELLTEIKLPYTEFKSAIGSIINKRAKEERHG